MFYENVSLFLFLSQNQVAVAAMSSFQVLLNPPDVEKEMSPLWEKAWSQWLSISREVVINGDSSNPPSQDFLVNMLQGLSSPI